MKCSRWMMTALFALPMLTTTAFADEDRDDNHQHEMVKMEDLPAPVKTTVQREAKGKTIVSIEKETENGATMYELELESKGKRTEVHISRTGKVLGRHPENHDMPDYD
ncbi:MAG TPA: hypothetical protein VFV99_04590 [Kofleriaceae bacterium]|nr:hypothetical protein [Kofleriaceae bacterium]